VIFDRPINNWTSEWLPAILEMEIEANAELVCPYPTLVSKAALLAEAAGGSPVLDKTVQRHHVEETVIRSAHIQESVA
jgi:hypothetical protein